MSIADVLLLFCICIFLLSSSLFVLKLLKKNNSMLYKIISLVNLLCALILVANILYEATVEIDIRDFVSQWSFWIVSSIYLLSSAFYAMHSFRIKR